VLPADRGDREPQDRSGTRHSPAGPRGAAGRRRALFAAAAHHGLVEEVERACRRQAFVDWKVYGRARAGCFRQHGAGHGARSSFLAGRARLPGRTTCRHARSRSSITERQGDRQHEPVSGEAMHAFLDLGFSFAIDDVGAGYSGLEAMANLGPAISSRHGPGPGRPPAARQPAGLQGHPGHGRRRGGTVIAEGIQTQDEADALRVLGVRYGQGYHFARPVDPVPPARRWWRRTPLRRRGAVAGAQTATAAR